MLQKLPTIAMTQLHYYLTAVSATLIQLLLSNLSRRSRRRVSCVKPPVVSKGESVRLGFPVFIFVLLLGDGDTVITRLCSNAGMCRAASFLDQTVFRRI